MLGVNVGYETLRFARLRSHRTFDKFFRSSRCRTARLSAVASASFVAVVLMTSLQAHGQDTWTLSSSLSGDWSDGGNWSAGVPTSSSTAYINYGGTANITTSGDVCGTLSLGSSAGSGAVQMTGGWLAANVSEYVGDSGKGAFTQSSGTNTISNFYLNVGNVASGSGSYSLSGGQLWARTENVGNSGAGVLAQSGGTNNLFDYLYLATNASSSGIYNLSGSGNLSSAGQYVGYSGTGSFAQSGGINNIQYNLNLAFNAGSSGSYNLSDGGSLADNSEIVGYSGMGSFTQSGGTNHSFGGLSLGDNAGSSGIYNLSGGLYFAGGSEYVGYSGTGSFSQSGGTNNGNSGSVLYLAYNTASNGTYNLGGGWLYSGLEMIGDSGTGSFTQSGGTNQTSEPVSGLLRRQQRELRPQRERQCVCHQRVRRLLRRGELHAVRRDPQRRFAACRLQRGEQRDLQPQREQLSDQQPSRDRGLLGDRDLHAVRRDQQLDCALLGYNAGSSGPTASAGAAI